MPRRGYRKRPYRLNGAKLLRALRAIACRKQNGRCYWCGEPMGEDVTADHLVPQHAGGKTIAGNIVAAHAVCNNGRHPELNKTHAPRALTAGDDRPSSPFEVLKAMGYSVP
jgi:5-methylcytosine-specific restriction endonuclease McrA